jgi:branched-chain amino acid transport system permease protein
VLVVAGTLLALIALGALLQRTTLGRSMRACSASRETSELLGISPERNGLITLVMAAMLGGLGGILITPAQFTSAVDAPFVYGVYGFVAAIFGGLGSLRGALAGGLLIGVLQAVVGRYLDPTYSTAIVFGALLVVLAFRPQGIFGGGEAEFF